MTTYPKHLSKNVQKKSREVWKPDSIFSSFFSVSTFVAFIFVFENSSIFFFMRFALQSIVIIVLRKSHTLRIPKIHIVLSSDRRQSYSAYGPSITCGLVKVEDVSSKIWLIWGYMFNGLVLWVVVRRGMFFWMILFFVVLGDLLKISPNPAGGE